MEPNTYTNYMEGLESQRPSRLERMAEKLRSVGHKIASFPILNMLGGMAAALFTGSATVLETIDAVAKGRYVRGIKNLFSGAVDTVATGALGSTGLIVGLATAGGVGTVFWIANAFSSLITGDSIPEHLRLGTKGILDTLDGANEKKISPLTQYARDNQVIGMSPQTIGMNTAGVGYAPWVPQQMITQPNPMMPGTYDPSRMPPNYWTNTIAQQQGMDPVEKRINWARSEDNRQHYRELHAARQQAAADAMGQPQRT